MNLLGYFSRPSLPSNVYEENISQSVSKGGIKTSALVWENESLSELKLLVGFWPITFLSLLCLAMAQSAIWYAPAIMNM